MADFEALTDDELAEQITTWAGRIAAGQAKMLALIGEFDRREAWAGPGLLSCAHWLSWRLGMGLAAAHERVRVAHALQRLPLTADAFGAGRVSWTQVRAITRVASPADEQTYLDCARHCSGAQIERLARGVRRARRTEEDRTDPELAAWRLRTRLSYDEDGTLVLSLRVPPEQGPVLLAALEAARADLDHERQVAPTMQTAAAGPTPTPTPTPAPTPAPAPAQGTAAGSTPKATSAAEPTPASRSSAEESAPTRPAPAASLADGLLRLAGDFLDHRAQQRPAAARRSRSALTIQVDPVSGWARLADGELLPPSSLRRVLPMLARHQRLRPLTARDLTRHDLGRGQRDPSLTLRELLEAVDGHRCRFPGCNRRRRLHAHHVLEWSRGGRTDLANLVLLCPRHHTTVHRHGFQLLLGANRRLGVRTATGVDVPHRPPLPWAAAEQLWEQASSTAPDAISPVTSGDRLDLRYAVAVLCQQAA